MPTTRRHQELIAPRSVLPEFIKNSLALAMAGINASLRQAASGGDERKRDSVDLAAASEFLVRESLRDRSEP